MSQSPASHDASSGALFSIERDRDALVEAVGDPDYADRLEALVADDGRAQSARLRALLQVGAERFGVETGLLARVDPAAGTHTIVERHGPSPAGPDDTADLSTTYGRTVIAENAVLGVTNAPEQGWDEDAAYDRFGAATYLGAKVVADGTLYGTVSFLDPDSRPDPFGEADAAALGLLADAIRRVLEREEGPPTPTRQQLEAVFEGSPVMINLHDLEGNLIAPNAHLCEKTGYSADELTQMNVWDLDQEVTPDRARANWADMAPGDRHRWEGRFRRKDGSTFPVEVDLRRLDVSGSARFAVTSRDITERKEAEAALRRSEELHRTTLGNITDAVLIAADDGTLTYVCPNVGYIFGYDQQEAERLGTVSALLGRDPAADHTLDDGEEITNVEQAITDAEGERHDLLINIRRVSIQGGTRMYTCRDITERKAAERELRSTKRLLEKTFESLDEVVLVVDPSQRRIVACNSAVEGTFGYDREELIGHSTEKLHVSPAAYERFGDIGEPILEAEGLFKHDYQMRRKDGTLIETEHVVTPLEGDDGPNGVVSVIRDVTERRRAERSLRKREDQLRGLANSLPGVVFQFYTRPDGTRGNYFVSEHTRSVLGIEADPDTFFERFRRRVPDAHRERFVASVETAVEQAEPWRHETPFDKPSGERIWLLGASTPVRREGELVYNGVLIDITERKAAEQALQDERDRFATLFHNLPTPVVRGRADDGRLQIRAVNEAFETTFGYDEDDARNEDIQALIVPEEERPTADSIRRRVLVGEPTIREVQREAVDGRRDFRVQVAIREGDAGPVEGFAIYTDITERKERERALAQRTALLEAQAEATIDGLLAVDDDRRVVFHNDPFLTLWALSAAAGDASGDALPGQRPLEALSDRVRRPEAFRETVASLYDRPDAEDRTLIRRTDGRWLDSTAPRSSATTAFTSAASGSSGTSPSSAACGSASWRCRRRSAAASTRRSTTRWAGSSRRSSSRSTSPAGRSATARASASRSTRSRPW